MKFTHASKTYSTRRSRRYPYPNEAEPAYFERKLLDGLTALATSMGTVTLLLFFLTF